MVGAAGNANSVFIIDNDYTVLSNSVPLPDSAYAPVYMNVPSTFTTYDIAYEGNANGTGEIWFATNATSPIRAYNTSGTLTYASNIIPSVRGMAFFSSGGHRYLWASCPSDGRIYLIDIDGTTGIEEGGTGTGECSLTCSGNPFSQSATFTGTGFAGGAILEVFDMTGRVILSSPFTGTCTWSDAAPAGVYCVRVSDPEGLELQLMVTRL